MNEKVQGNRVPHAVTNKRATVAWLKRVFVNPLPVGATNLFVHEAMRGPPFVDASSPAQWHAAHAEAVVDQRPLAHDDGCRCDDAEVQPRRRDGVEVSGVREKREKFR